MKYLRHFLNDTEYNNFYWSDNYYEPLVGYVGQNNNGTSVFNKIEHILTFKSKRGFSITISEQGKTLTSLPFQYSLNQGLSWTSRTLSERNPSVTLEINMEPYTIQLRGTNFYSTDGYYINIQFTPLIGKPTPDDYIYSFGDVTSLLDNIGGDKELKAYAFRNLFSGNCFLRTAPKLPSTKLAESCYDSMFSGCTLLEKAPILPSTSTASNCYDSMFSGCDSLNEITLLCQSSNDPALAFRNWLSHVDTAGILHVPRNIDTNVLNNIDIPRRWTVEPF